MSVHPSDQHDWAVGDESGLDVLKDVDKIVIEQQLDMLEAVSGIDQPNKYKVLNDDDKQLFFMEEENSGSFVNYRGFTVNAKDPYGKKVFHVERPMKCCSYCFFCCSCISGCKSEAKVKAGGKKIGEMIQDWSVRDVKFSIYDDKEDKVFKVIGRIECCTLKAEYEIKTKDGDTKLGTIKKDGEGLGQGCNRYKIKFPENTSPQMKAMIISITILFDYRFHYYVSPHHRRRR